MNTMQMFVNDNAVENPVKIPSNISLSSVIQIQIC